MVPHLIRLSIFQFIPALLSFAINSLTSTGLRPVISISFLSIMYNMGGVTTTDEKIGAAILVLGIITFIAIILGLIFLFTGFNNTENATNTSTSMVHFGPFRRGPRTRPTRSLISMPYGPFVVPRPLAPISEGYCVAYPSLSSGAISVPAGKVSSLYGEEWTISMFIKVNDDPERTKPFTFLTLGLAHPSPRMNYYPGAKTIELVFTNKYNVSDSTMVSTYPVDLSQFNHITWVQTRNFLQFYINGALVADKALVAPAKINKYNDFFIESQGLIEFKNIKLCDRAWTTQTVLSEIVS